MHGIAAAADRTAVGVGLSFLSFMILSVADAMTKLLSGGYSIFEIAIIDGLVALLVVVPALIRTEGFAGLRPRRPGLVILRAAIGAASLLTAFLAFSTIPLAEAYALAFIAPLIVTGLSVPMLGEHVGWRQWTAVVIGFIAVIVILRPDFHGLELGQIYILISALLFALSMLILRKVSGTEPNGGLLGTYFVAVVVMSVPFAIGHWQMPSLRDFAVMVVVGLASGIGNLLLIHAFRKARASIVSSFMYIELIWGTCFGIALFGDLPDLVTIGGAIVLVGCGLYTLVHASASPRRVAA